MEFSIYTIKNDIRKTIKWVSQERPEHFECIQDGLPLDLLNYMENGSEYERQHGTQKIKEIIVEML